MSKTLKFKSLFQMGVGIDILPYDKDESFHIVKLYFKEGIFNQNYRFHISKRLLFIGRNKLK